MKLISIVQGLRRRTPCQCWVDGNVSVSSTTQTSKSAQRHLSVFTIRLTPVYDVEQLCWPLLPFSSLPPTFSSTSPYTYLAGPMFLQKVPRFLVLSSVNCGHGPESATVSPAFYARLILGAEESGEFETSLIPDNITQNFFLLPRIVLSDRNSWKSSRDSGATTRSEATS